MGVRPWDHIKKVQSHFLTFLILLCHRMNNNVRNRLKKIYFSHTIQSKTIYYSPSRRCFTRPSATVREILFRTRWTGCRETVDSTNTLKWIGKKERALVGRKFIDHVQGSHRERDIVVQSTTEKFSTWNVFGRAKKWYDKRYRSTNFENSNSKILF